MFKLTKILIKPGTLSNKKTESAYAQQLRYLAIVWEDNTYGLERILRLFLSLAQFAFPILLIRDIFGRFGTLYRKLAVEFYTLLKLIFPLLVLAFGLYQYPFVVAVIVYLLSETILHILNLIFLYDVHSAAVSYHRSLLLLFLHYLEVVFDFAVVYIGFDLLNESLSPVSALYFSMVANTTVGFGDIHAKGAAGQLVVIAQLIVCVLFIVLFINHFSQKENER